MAREVDLVRLVFCDAAAYDQGYVPPEDITGRVRVILPPVTVFAVECRITP